MLKMPSHEQKHSIVSLGGLRACEDGKDVWHRFYPSKAACPWMHAHALDVHLMSLYCSQSKVLRKAVRIPNRKSSSHKSTGRSRADVPQRFHFNKATGVRLSSSHSYTPHNSSRQLVLLWTWRPLRLKATLACLSLRWQPRSEGLRVCGTATDIRAQKLPTK